MNLIDRPNGAPGPVGLPIGGSSAEVIVHVVGEIDIFTEPALTRRLDAQLQPARHLTSLVVDLSSVAFIGVRGFAALLAAATNAHHRDVAFSLVGCGPGVLRLLAVLDPEHTLTVRADSGHARNGGRPRSSGFARTRNRSQIRKPAGEVICPRPDRESLTAWRGLAPTVGSAVEQYSYPDAR